MNPEKMDLTELQHLRTVLDAAAKAGKIMEEAGLAPTFAVSAYTPLMTVPPIGDLKSAEIDRLAQVLAGTTAAPYVPGPRQAVAERIAPICKDGPREREAPAAEVTSAAAAPADHPETQPAAEDLTSPASERQAETLAASDQPAANAQSNKAAGYSPEDIDLAITIYCDVMDLGGSKARAYELVARKLGRSEDAIAFQFKTKWRDRAETELRSRANIAKDPDPAPADEAAPNPDYADPLTQHLATLPWPKGWNFAADRDLVEMILDGVDAATIAANLEVTPAFVRQRWDLLTGLHKDENDKQQRRWTGPEISARLHRIIEDQKKGKAA